MGILRRCALWWEEKGDALLHYHCVHFLRRLFVLNSCLDVNCNQILRRILVSQTQIFPPQSTNQFFPSFSISGIAANTYAYLGEFHCDANRARQLSFAGVFMAFALTFCPGLGWLILKFEHIASINFFIPIIQMNFSIWRIFLLICASVSGFVSILLFFLPESPKFLLAQGRHDEVLKILRKIYRWNNNKMVYDVDRIYLDELLAKKTSQRPPFLHQLWNQTSPLFKSPLLKNTLKTSFVMFSLFAASSGFFLWTPDILNKLQDYKTFNNLTVCDVIDDVVRLKRM